MPKKDTKILGLKKHVSTFAKFFGEVGQFADIYGYCILTAE